MLSDFSFIFTIDKFCECYALYYMINKFEQFLLNHIFIILF